MRLKPIFIIVCIFAFCYQSSFGGSVFIEGYEYNKSNVNEFTGMPEPSVSPIGKCRLYYDSTADKLKLSENSGAYSDIGGGSAPEGTAVLSTGEGGGSKYLREDGDGTCSWQTPAGAGDMEAADWDGDSNNSIDVDAGGTNLTSYTPYSIHWSSSANTFNEIGIGLTLHLLRVNAGVDGYEWVAPTNTFTAGTNLSWSGITLNAANPEGAAVLSTGEGGGSKYLREDGDGTCSWQTPAGSGDLLADGSVPLTADWDIGNFDIILKDLTGDGTIEGATITEGGVEVYNSGENCGGELGGTWASPTINDNIAVTGWDVGASTGTTPGANDADTSLATTAFCEMTQDYLKTSEFVGADEAYDATGWDGDTSVPEKDDIRDKIETMNTAIGLNTSKNTNVSTTLEAGTVNATTYGITSDGGADDIVLPEADTTNAGLLGADKWDEIVANSLKVTERTTVNAPLVISTYDLSISSSGATSDGYLKTADWNTFNNKEGALTDEASLYSTLSDVTGFFETDDTDEVNDTHIDWGSGANQVDLADILGGDAPDNYNFDFTGSTVTLPNVAGDVSLIAVGQIAVDSAQNQLVVNDGSEKAINLDHFMWGALNLAGWHDVNSNFPIIELDASLYPDGIVITGWEIDASVADPTTELDMNLMYCDDPTTGAFPGANAVLVDVMDTTTGNSSEADMSNSDLTSGVIPTGKFMYLDMDTDPTDDNTFYFIKIEFYIPES